MHIQIENRPFDRKFRVTCCNLYIIVRFEDRFWDSNRHSPGGTHLVQFEAGEAPLHPPQDRREFEPLEQVLDRNRDQGYY